MGRPQVCRRHQWIEEDRARSVWLSPTDDHGTRTLVVRAASAGIRGFHGTVDHIAHLLRERGNAEQRALSMDELRAEAIILLGIPFAALKLLVVAGESDCPEVVAELIRTASASKVRPQATVYVHFSTPCCRARGWRGPRPSALDRDHTVAYDEDGPPGQTAEPNLGKMTRHHHRIKTHAGWTVEQQGGRFTWTTPHGRVFVTDGRGTRRRVVRPVSVHVTPTLDVVWPWAA